MFFRIHQVIASFVVAGFIAGCASTPPHVQEISSSANPTTEIEKTEAMLKEAKANQVDALSPKNFTEAEKALEKAKSKKERNKANEDILEQVAYSRAWLNEANAKAEVVRTSLKDIADARGGALRAGAPSLYAKDWQKAEKDLEKVTHSVEKGNLRPVDKKGEDLVSRYRNLEVMSVTRANLGIARDNIDTALKEGAEKGAPRSLAAAKSKYEAAERAIMSQPRNPMAFTRISQDATRESQHLVDVTRKVTAGNSEDLILMTERQQRQISNLRSDYASVQTDADRTRMELERQQELLNRAQALRGELAPSEAEVFVENDKLKVRLKGLQFPSAQSELGPRNQALLKKVDSALAGLRPSRVIVEGHTDSVGSPEANRILSEKRAQSVEKFLVSQGAIRADRVEAVGKGFDNPIGDNRTAAGRAQNRRIDLVIETE